MLVSKEGYDKDRSEHALNMLLIDRRNEFKELAEVLLVSVPSSMHPIPNWEKFVLNFCLDVSMAFKTWSGKMELSSNSDLKALTILRQLSRNKSSMIQMTHLLNIAFDLAEEFKIIYKRIE